MKTNSGKARGLTKDDYEAVKRELITEIHDFLLTVQPGGSSSLVRRRWLRLSSKGCARR